MENQLEDIKENKIEITPIKTSLENVDVKKEECKINSTIGKDESENEKCSKAMEKINNEEVKVNTDVHIIGDNKTCSDDKNINQEKEKPDDDVLKEKLLPNENVQKENNDEHNKSLENINEKLKVEINDNLKENLIITNDDNEITSIETKNETSLSSKVCEKTENIVAGESEKIEKEMETSNKEISCVEEMPIDVGIKREIAEVLEEMLQPIDSDKSATTEPLEIEISESPNQDLESPSSPLEATRSSVDSSNGDSSSVKEVKEEIKVDEEEKTMDVDLAKREIVEEKEKVIVDHDEKKTLNTTIGEDSEYESLEEERIGDEDRPEEYGSDSEVGEEEEEEEQEDDDDEDDEEEEEDVVISDHREGSGSSSPEMVINEERQAADGQESDKKERKLDHDEDRRDPQYIPKKGMFYEHDDRTADGEEQKKETPRDTKKGKVWDSKESWTHDLYVESEQNVKSTDEIIAVYGYDIRKDDGPPKARRRRRYVKGPNKYDRNWEDEQAYIKSPGRGNFRGGRRIGRGRLGGNRNAAGNSGGMNTSNNQKQKEFEYKPSDFPIHQPNKKSPENSFGSPPKEENWDLSAQKTPTGLQQQQQQQQRPSSAPQHHNKPSPSINRLHQKPTYQSDHNRTSNVNKSNTQQNHHYHHNNNNHHHHQQHHQGGGRGDDHRNNDDQYVGRQQHQHGSGHVKQNEQHPVYQQQQPQGQPSQRGRGRGRISSLRPPISSGSYSRGGGGNNTSNSGPQNDNKTLSINSQRDNQTTPTSAGNISLQQYPMPARSTADEDIATLAQHFSQAVINIDNKHILRTPATTPTATTHQTAPLTISQALHQHQQQQQQQANIPTSVAQTVGGGNPPGTPPINNDRYKIDESAVVGQQHVDKGNSEHQRSKRYTTQRQRALPPIQHSQVGTTGGQQPPVVPPPNMAAPPPPPTHVPPPAAFMHQQPPPPPTAYYHTGCVDSDVVAAGQVPPPVEVVTFLQPPHHTLHYVQPQFIQTPSGPIIQTPPPPAGPEMYQGGGITYYNTLSQMTQSRPNCGASRRLKVAIPIVAPPPQEQQQLQQQQQMQVTSVNNSTA